MLRGKVHIKFTTNKLYFLFWNLRLSLNAVRIHRHKKYSQHSKHTGRIGPTTWRILSNTVHDNASRGQLKCDGTREEARFCLSAKRTSPFKSEWASVQSTTGSRGVRINGSNAGYTMFRGSVKGTGYPLHSPVSPSLPLPCVTVCHYISTGAYLPICIKQLLQHRAVLKCPQLSFSMFTQETS